MDLPILEKGDIISLFSNDIFRHTKELSLDEWKIINEK